MTDALTEIERALDRDDLPAAAALAMQAFDGGAREPLVFNLVAWRHEEDGRFAEAEDVLRQALANWPDDPSLHLALGVVLRKVGRLREAAEAFERAIELDFSYAAAWFERGVTFEQGGASADAIRDFSRVIELEPKNANAQALLAAILARRGDAEAATRHANAALRFELGNPTAMQALALIAMEKRDYDAVIALLEPVVAASDGTETVVGAQTLLGDAYEGVGRYDDAYQSYAAAQALFHGINSGRMGESAQDALDAVARIAASLEAADPALWDAPAPADKGPAATHVFLTGYPRSGTTLVENILATLPDAVAIEERRTLAMIDQAYLREVDGLTRFASLPEPELAAYREGYWQRATEAAQEGAVDKLFIDMDPFKGMRLPIISRLFPDAKVVLMRRDPRDVVWSCFHTSFAFNSGTLAFATLESTARHYALTQAVIERSLATLPLNVMELRYEELVRDFDATTQALCTFVGAEWSPELRQFDRTAKRRGVSTASTTQVRRGLYDGSGGWRRYERQLAEVEPILRPWIEKFGHA